MKMEKIHVIFYYIEKRKVLWKLIIEYIGCRLIHFGAHDFRNTDFFQLSIEFYWSRVGIHWRQYVCMVYEDKQIIETHAFA